MQFGFTFLPQHAKHLGLAPRQALRELLELGFDWVRISARWDEIEPYENKFKFSSLDWQLQMLRKYPDVKIVLTVGCKAPRWPEFYLPDWILWRFKFEKSEAIADLDFAQYLLRFVQTVIKKYEKNRQIAAVQIENEPLDPWGPQRWSIHPLLLSREIDLARVWTKKPVILTQAGVLPGPQNWRRRSKNLQMLAGLADIVGLNVYQKIEAEIFGRSRIFEAKQRDWKRLTHWRRLLEGWDRVGWIAELQAEPWPHYAEASRGKEKDFADHHKTCCPEDIEDLVQKIQEVNFETIFFWGAEFWLWAKKQGNEKYLETIKKIIK